MLSHAVRPTAEYVRTDAKPRQGFGKHIGIVLRIGARARHLAHIGDHSDLRALEQVRELTHWPRRMSDGEERMRRMSLWITRVCAEADSPCAEPRGRSCRSNLVLRVLLARVVDISFVIHILGGAP